MSALTRTLIGASIPFVLMVLYIVSAEQPHTTPIAVLDVGVEHTTSMTLSMTITANDTLRVVDIENDATENIAISLPDTWKRGEVRNVPLKSITSEAPSFGYVRWTIPKNASVTFKTKHPFEHLSIHNPSGIPLKIRLTSVDLQKNTGDHQVYLVKEGSVQIP